MRHPSPQPPKPPACHEGFHVGPPVDAVAMDRFADEHDDGFSRVWRTQATCAACRATVDRSRFGFRAHVRAALTRWLRAVRRPDHRAFVPAGSTR